MQMSGGIKINDIWRKRYNKGLTWLFGNLDILSFVRMSRLNWIGLVNRMDSERRVSQVFNNNQQGSRLGGRQKKTVELCTNRYNKCKIKN